MNENRAGLPQGSIVALYDSALCRDDQQGQRFPWAETAGYR